MRTASARSMNRTNRRCSAFVLIAVLLCVGSASAVKPVWGPVDKIVFIHYKGAAAKPSSAAEPAATYKQMGVKWGRFPVTYYINPTNPGPDPKAVTPEFTAAFGAWDAASLRVSFSYG
jgi:hypothetical protein